MTLNDPIPVGPGFRPTAAQWEVLVTRALLAAEAWATAKARPKDRAHLSPAAKSALMWDLARRREVTCSVLFFAIERRDDLVPGALWDARHARVRAEAAP